VQSFQLQRAVGTAFRYKRLSSGAYISDIPEWKLPLGRPRRRWEIILKLIFSVKRA